MRQPHVCASCGFCLTRIPALVDPHYGLPLVVCPGCATACVRRPHPIPRRWRHAKFLLGSLLALLFAVVGAILALCVPYILNFAMGFTLQDYRLTPFRAIAGAVRADPDVLDDLWAWRSDGGDVLFAMWVFAAALLGVWLASALPHWRRGRLWLAWLSGTTLTHLITFGLALYFDMAEHHRQPESGSRDDILAVAVNVSQAIALLMLIAAIGLPIGRVFRRVLDARAASAFARRRRRLRRRQQRT